MKIGITERGDAGLDFSWVEKLKTVDGAIIISKYLSDELINKLIEHQEKLVFHCTCTGYGSTKLEPNTMSVEWTHDQLYNLVERGFDPKRIVLRTDPVIPTERGLSVFGKTVAYTYHKINRFRFSILDMYPHVRERFKAAGLPLPYGDSFSASNEQFQMVADYLRDRLLAFKFEVCAEPRLPATDRVRHVGCVSKTDLEILGFSVPENMETGKQRKGCMCLNCKTELLTRKHPCKNRCLYCYWKD